MHLLTKLKNLFWEAANVGYIPILLQNLYGSNNAHNHNALNSYEKARKNYVCRIGILFDGIVKMWTFEKKVRIYSRKKPQKYVMLSLEFQIN